MKNNDKFQETTNFIEASAPGGETAPAGAVSPPGAGSRELPSFTLPDPEVCSTKGRRKFTAKYKLKILQEAAQCTKQGDIGALLRREGLYSSHLTNWRRQRREGIIKAVQPKKRGRKKKVVSPLEAEFASLQKENQMLKQSLKKAQAIIEVQKKISEILGIGLEQIPNEEVR